MEDTYETHILRDGKTIKLATQHVGRGDHVDSYPDIMVRTRTGKKVHKGSPGSSVTNCGVWLRASGSNYKMDPAAVHSEHLCEHCYPVARDEPSTDMHALGIPPHLREVTP